jgi:hypothetical protein
LNVILAAAKSLMRVFFAQSTDPGELIKELVGYANKARKDGIVSLDSELPNIQDPFMKKSLMLAVDGLNPKTLREMLEIHGGNAVAPKDGDIRLVGRRGLNLIHRLREHHCVVSLSCPRHKNLACVGLDELVAELLGFPLDNLPVLQFPLEAVIPGQFFELIDGEQSRGRRHVLDCNGNR